MEAQDVVLDEIVWRSAAVAQMMGGVHENSVLHYFAESPFFDQTSNNASLAVQAMYNPSMAYVLATRFDFEGALRAMQGLEFVVAHRPQDFYGEPQISQGVWVIRKQNRRKQPASDDDVTILATYFVVGENIYKAPSLHDIVSSRMLSITLALNKVLSTAASLPTFTPAHGHRYFPPVIKSMADATAVAAQGARENSVAPANPIPQSSARDSEDPLSSASSDVAGAHTLYEAFNQYLRYGNEYMDENPLVGEPGAFVFSSSKQQLQAQQQAEQKAPGGKMQIQIQQSASPQPSPLSSPQPLPEVTVLRKPIKVTNQVVNGGQSKPKRRKSKAPTSPASPLNSASLA